MATQRQSPILLRIKAVEWGVGKMARGPSFGLGGLAIGQVREVDNPNREVAMPDLVN
jgi:hypothetical protein